MTLRERIRDHLRGRDDLLKNSVWPLDHPLAGHCYVASEAYFHLTGGYDEWYVERTSVHVPKPLGDMAEFTHWYLRDRETGEVVDLTKEQFTEYQHGDVYIPYDKGTRTGFLTDEPSERAEEVIESINTIAAEKRIEK